MNLANYDVQEMNVQEMKEVTGGSFLLFACFLVGVVVELIFGDN